MRNLRLALTKGRLEKDMTALLRKAGADTEALEKPGRRLLLPVPALGLEVVLAKAPDVVTYVEHGVCDLGVAGKDTILEQGRSFFEMLDLGFGRCRFALAVREGEDFWDTVKPRRIATKYPHVARQFFASRGMDCEIIRIEGSVELAPLLGLADAIVDIVETGATLRANGLVPIEDITDVSARLICNVAAMKTRKTEMTELIDRLKEAVRG